MPRSGTANGRKPVKYPVDAQFVVDPGGTRLLFEHPAFPKKPKPKRHWVRWIVVGVIASAIIWAGVHLGCARLRYSWTRSPPTTPSSPATSPMSALGSKDVVTEVLVDQNDRVEPGTLLVRLDREPFEVAVAESKASLEEARANVDPVPGPA